MSLSSWSSEVASGSWIERLKENMTPSKWQAISSSFCKVRGMYQSFSSQVRQGTWIIWTLSSLKWWSKLDAWIWEPQLAAGVQSHRTRHAPQGRETRYHQMDKRKFWQERAAQELLQCPEGRSVERSRSINRTPYRNASKPVINPEKEQWLPSTYKCVLCP